MDIGLGGGEREFSGKERGKYPDVAEVASMNKKGEKGLRRNAREDKKRSQDKIKVIQPIKGSWVEEKMGCKRME